MTREEFEQAYYEGLALCGNRYAIMAQALEQNTIAVQHLCEFIEEYRRGVCNRIPLLKLNRWLGYIQACLIGFNTTTVEEERDWTRPLFRPLDFGSID